MPAESNPALALLRDIHDAPAIPAWPPAPGWWILALLILALLVWVAYRLIQVARRRRLRARVLARLDSAFSTAAKNPRLGIANLNHLLKQVALFRFGRRRVAGLHGMDWLEFLQSGGPADALDVPRVLATGAWQPEPQGIDLTGLRRWAESWIKANV